MRVVLGFILDYFQALGGVRGAQHWTLSTISKYISAARQLVANLSDSKGGPLTVDEVSRFEQLALPSIEKMALRVDRHGQSGINFRDAYAEGDDNNPFPFLYESADCRLFYTAENVLHPATTCEVAASVMYRGAPCVQGSANATGLLTTSRVEEDRRVFAVIHNIRSSIIQFWVSR